MDRRGADGAVSVATRRRDGRLVFVSESAQGRGRYTYEFGDDPDVYTFSLENARDGEPWTELMDSMLRRSR